jgi:lysophospholipase L1-like esterase
MLLRLTLLAFFLTSALSAQTRTILIDSPAFVFSPANWTGNTDRAGSAYRQTWYPGAYFRVTWTTTSESPIAELLLDTSSYGDKLKTLPELTYCIDGVWTGSVKAADRIKIANLKGAGPHALAVYLKTTDQVERWGTPAASGLNVLRVKGLAVDANSVPAPHSPAKHWALIIGDSITEGNAADFGRSDNLAAWSYFVGVGLQSLGYEYGVTACGYSGWLRPGDSAGDVPAYYSISHSQNGTEGTYNDARSRWNKIDARTSLLDANQHLSAYGQTGQEPSVILINFGTNDGLKNVNRSDLQASIIQSLLALQKAAPDALIVVIIPFGQYAASELKTGVEAVRTANPSARNILLIDLGPSVAQGLAANGYWSGLHPNMRGHATFAAQILARVIPELSAK